MASTDAPLPTRDVTLPPPRFQSLRVIGALVLREMSSTYGRSPGGYIWALASPIGTITVMALCFSLLVRTPPLGTSFILFYATGFLPFGIFGTLSNKIGSAVRYSRALLAYPRVNWLDAMLARLILNGLTEAVVFCLVMGGILAFVDIRSMFHIGPILAGMAMAVSFATGVGLMNSLLTGYFPTWDRIWGIIRSPLMLASGVIFLYDDLSKDIQAILWWNPLIHAIGLVRRGFYSTYYAPYVSLTYGFGVSMVLIAVALIFLRRGYLATLED